ncbi:hypothetical protein [Deinococcus aestuarii]|uniref:hypothetical protein n=1 Tax=Deinococcus aestuarii TaxID=2774531 RepID=UPI001C0DB9AD|nr:hypothetical protein [Deinococcus aestuarii]
MRALTFWQAVAAGFGLWWAVRGTPWAGALARARALILGTLSLIRWVLPGLG